MKKFTISEVMDSFGVSKFTWKIFFLLGAAMVFDGYDYQIVAYTMTQIKASFPMSDALAGSLSAWSMLGMICGGVMSGLLSDKLGRKKTLTFAILLYSLLNLPLYWSSSFAMFAIFRVAAGIGLGACIPVVTTMFSESTPTNKRAWFITFGMAWMVVGWTVAGIIGSAVVNSNPDNWRMCYLIAFLPFIYGIFLLFRMRESPYWLASKGRKAEAVEELRRIEKAARGTVSDYDPNNLVVPEAPKRTGPAALFSKKYIRVTAGVWLTYFCGCFLIYGLNAWGPTLMQDKGFQLSSANWLATAKDAASVLANISVGFVAEIVGRKKNLVAAFFVAAVAVFAMFLVGGSFGMVLAANIFLGFALNYANTCVQPLMAEAYPTEFRNTGVAWCQAFGRIAGMVSPVLVGVLHGRFGAANSGRIYLLYTIPCVIGALAGIFFITRETKGKSLDQLANEN
ncbi:MAG: MFS transporter [Oscillospiraceae bacterium]|jgi:MFS family permease|nr:MFS transporter [Oscillospiraceae bacterium]